MCIEIFSSDDTLKSIEERLNDYAQMGVGCSWVIDPWKRAVYRAGLDGLPHPASDTLTVPETPISISVEIIFAELDRLEKRVAASRP